MKWIIVLFVALSGCATDSDYLERVRAYQTMQRPAYVVPPPQHLTVGTVQAPLVCTPGYNYTMVCQ